MSDSLSSPEPGPALAPQAGASTRALRLRRYRWPLLVAIAAVLSLGGGAWYLRDASDAGRAATAPGGNGSAGGRPEGAAGRPGGPGGRDRVMPIVVEAATSEDFPVRLSAIGTVVPRALVTVRSRVDGPLERIAFEEGQAVRAGDLLAEIDPRPFEVALLQVQGQMARDQALLANARADLVRYEGLARLDAIPAQQLDTQRALVRQYEAAVKVDQGQVDSARLQLSYTRITAPTTGRVGLRQVDPGNLVRASDANGIVVITQVQPVTVIFPIPEAELGKVLARLGLQTPRESSRGRGFGRQGGGRAGERAGNQAAIDVASRAPGAGGRPRADGEGNSQRSRAEPGEGRRDRVADGERPAGGWQGRRESGESGGGVERPGPGREAAGDARDASERAENRPRRAAMGDAPGREPGGAWQRARPEAAPVVGRQDERRGDSVAADERRGTTDVARREERASDGLTALALWGGEARGLFAARDGGGRLDRRGLGRRKGAGGALAVEAWDRDGKVLLATGELLTVDNQIDVSTGTVKVKAIFANQDGALFPNQFVNVRLVVNELKGVTVIPAAAVQRGARGSFVWLLNEDQTVSMRQIGTGTPDGDLIPILEGLQAGEKVAVDGFDRLREGAKVEVVSRESRAVKGGPGKRGGRRVGGQGGPGTTPATPADAAAAGAPGSGPGAAGVSTSAPAPTGPAGGPPGTRPQP